MPNQRRSAPRRGRFNPRAVMKCTTTASSRMCSALLEPTGMWAPCGQTGHGQWLPSTSQTETSCGRPIRASPRHPGRAVVVDDGGDLRIDSA